MKYTHLFLQFSDVNMFTEVALRRSEHMQLSVRCVRLSQYYYDILQKSKITILD